ncbi:hypothetical protein [Dictyobacter arantiisoli]|nr:hypothetical protein [Dictyobacter arantiisoli]
MMNPEIEMSNIGHNPRSEGFSTAPGFLRSVGEVQYREEGALRRTRSENDFLVNIPRLSQIREEFQRNQTDRLDDAPDQTAYQPALLRNDEEMGNDRSGDVSESWSAFMQRKAGDFGTYTQRKAGDFGTYTQRKAGDFGTYLVTPQGNSVPERIEFVPGTGWKSYLESKEIDARRALLTPLADVGINAAIATANNANTWLQAGKIIPVTAVGSFIGTIAANKTLDKLSKPWDKIGQTAVGQGATLGITYLGLAISKAMHKE